jgi:hypothetical protein
MFAGRYFAARYFAPRYFTSATPVVTPGKGYFAHRFYPLRYYNAWYFPPPGGAFTSMPDSAPYRIFMRLRRRR